MLIPTQFLASLSLFKCECASSFTLVFCFSIVLFIAIVSFKRQKISSFECDEESPVMVPIQGGGWGGYEVVHFERPKRRRDKFH
jgi:hypothetical protein